MTVSTTVQETVFIGDGITTTFFLAARVLDKAHVKVATLNTVSGELTEVAPSAFSVAGVGDANGVTITYPLAGDPLSADYKLIVKREVPYTQTTDIINQGGFYPEVVETALDNLEMQIQQKLGKDGSWSGGLFLMPPGEPSETLPPAQQRAGTLLGFGLDGKPKPIAQAGGTPIYTLNPKGDWAAGNEYRPLDVVTDGGSSWMALVVHTSAATNRPPHAEWQLLARAGDDLSDGAVTTPKLADESVTTPKLAKEAVTTGKIAPGAVGQAQLAKPAPWIVRPVVNTFSLYSDSPLFTGLPGWSNKLSLASGGTAEFPGSFEYWKVDPNATIEIHLNIMLKAYVRLGTTANLDFQFHVEEWIGGPERRSQAFNVYLPEEYAVGATDGYRTYPLHISLHKIVQDTAEDTVKMNFNLHLSNPGHAADFVIVQQSSIEQILIREL